MNNSEQIIVKLKKHFNLHEDKELAEYLEVSQAVLSSWKRRDALQWDIVFKKIPVDKFTEIVSENQQKIDSSNKENVDFAAELKQAKFEAEFYKNHCDEKITNIEKSIAKISSSFDILIHLLGIGQQQEKIKEEVSRGEAEIHRAKRLIQPKPKPIPHDP